MPLSFKGPIGTLLEDVDHMGSLFLGNTGPNLTTYRMEFHDENMNIAMQNVHRRNKYA
jgi:hypothetical protein